VLLEAENPPILHIVDPFAGTSTAHELPIREGLLSMSPNGVLVAVSSRPGSGAAIVVLNVFSGEIVDVINDRSPVESHDAVVFDDGSVLTSPRVAFDPLVLYRGGERTELLAVPGGMSLALDPLGRVLFGIVDGQGLFSFPLIDGRPTTPAVRPEAGIEILPCTELFTSEGGAFVFNNCKFGWSIGDDGAPTNSPYFGDEGGLAWRSASYSVEARAFATVEPDSKDYPGIGHTVLVRDDRTTNGATLLIPPIANGSPEPQGRFAFFSASGLLVVVVSVLGVDFADQIGVVVLPAP
ncbi:MAG: hypothetical protein Q8O67_23625, partial [Deltaproteobacteria bacterium]|nr:hypothetical protein [Deltaproteobacteria bacterium]